MLEQPQIAVDVARLDAANLGERVRDRAAIVEGIAVGEAETVPRVKRHKLDVVLQPLAEQLEQFLEQEMRGDYGWTGVVAEAVARQDLRTPAKHRQAVEQSDAIPFCAQAKGRRHAAKPAA